MKGYAETLDPGSPEAAIAGRYLDHQLEQMAMGKKLGVSMAVGTDAGSMGVNHGEAVVEELELFAKAGFTVEEAIGCAARKAACLLGLDTLGVLRPGKKAAFVAVKGRPENIFQNYRQALSGRNSSERLIIDF
jgi:imidazolonepropionase-like amidohydrolase